MSGSGGLKFDGGKPRMSLLPFDALEQVAWTLNYGAEKYEPRSWAGVPNAEERYLDATIRHLGKHADGELLDDESHMPHLAHAAVCCLFILHFLRARAAIPVKYDLTGVREKFAKERGTAATAKVAEHLRKAHPERESCPECP